MLMAIPGLTIDNLLIIFTMIDRQGDALFTVSVGLHARHQRPAAIAASARAATGLLPTAARSCPALRCRHDPDSKWARYWRSLPDKYYTGAQHGVLSSHMMHALSSHMLQAASRGLPSQMRCHQLRPVMRACPARGPALQACPFRSSWWLS